MKAKRQSPAAIAVKHPPTAKQQQALDAVLRLTIENKRAPTLRELGAVLGTSTNAVVNHVRALRRKGLLQPGDGHAGVRLVVQDRCPCCGQEIRP